MDCEGTTALIRVEVCDHLTIVEYTHSVYLYPPSKGEAKSKVTKSVKFGGGQWQVGWH